MTKTHSDLTALFCLILGNKQKINSKDREETRNKTREKIFTTE